MTETTKNSPGEAEVTFARNLGLFDATMIGIGAMIGAGIFVLTGIAAGEVGPGALLAFALNGLVTLLTALAYAELASAYPKSGGGYAFITKAFPRATLISLAVTVFIYLMILLVCIGAIQPESGKSWQFLGQYQETAIARAAQSFMPAFGVVLIIFGGLLSTISALNATILASSRVAFSMSRDKMLPLSLSTIHPRRRTPHIAIAVTGAIVIFMALLFPIQVIGSAASVMFLLTFTLTNLSLIALRRKFPELKGGFRVPLYPATPIAAIILNMFLAIYQFNFDPRAWYIAIAWIIFGSMAAKVIKQTPRPLLLVPVNKAISCF